MATDDHRRSSLRTNGSGGDEMVPKFLTGPLVTQNQSRADALQTALLCEVSLVLFLRIPSQERRPDGF